MPFNPPQTPQNCNQCDDTGILWDTVYYPFCDLPYQRFCLCPAGDDAFKKWVQSDKVQNALKEKRQKSIENALEFSCIPKRWQEKKLESLKGQEEIKIKINHYLDNFLSFRKKGRGMYLWSIGSGRGKTHILSALCQQIIDRYILPCIFVSEEQMYRKIRTAFDEPKIIEQKIINKLHTIECLFIDDFGATKITSWKNEVLTALLDYRLQNCLPTFFTSNYSPQDYEFLTTNTSIVARPERISSRIYEMCRIIEIQGDDWRKKSYGKKSP